MTIARTPGALHWACGSRERGNAGTPQPAALECAAPELQGEGWAGGGVGDGGRCDGWHCILSQAVLKAEPLQLGRGTL